MKDNRQSRRSVIKTILGSIIGGFAGLLGMKRAPAAPPKKRNTIQKMASDRVSQGEVPLYSSTVTHNGLVYLSGIGYHEEGDITKHTKEVLDILEKRVREAGSSMDRVLKVNVYLADLDDYDAMNKVYRGRFGDNPPVRTTVATYGGVPGDSLVEIDCIAALKDG